MFDQVLPLSVSIARQAGELLRTHFQTGLAAGHKGVIDLVTRADLESEALIVSRLRQAFPTHHILAEEGGGDEQASDLTWLVDPLDGTTNFVHGYPQFSVSLALRQCERVVLGVVYDVMRDELYTAVRGGGARLNGRSLRVSGTPALGSSLLVTGFPYDRQTNPHNNLDQFKAFLMRSQGVLRLGSAALDLCAVAAGRLDGYWELHLKPWDWAAGVLLVEEAGGRVSEWDGRPFRPDGQCVVASNGCIHNQMLAVLARSSAG